LRRYLLKRFRFIWGILCAGRGPLQERCPYRFVPFMAPARPPGGVEGPSAGTFLPGIGKKGRANRATPRNTGKNRMVRGAKLWIFFHGPAPVNTREEWRIMGLLVHQVRGNSRVSIIGLRPGAPSTASCPLLTRRPGRGPACSPAVEGFWEFRRGSITYKAYNHRRTETPFTSNTCALTAQCLARAWTGGTFRAGGGGVGGVTAPNLPGSDPIFRALSLENGLLCGPSGYGHYATAFGNKQVAEDTRHTGFLYPSKFTHGGARLRSWQKAGSPTSRHPQTSSPACNRREN